MQLRQELEDTLAEEVAAAERVRDEARARAGAFPLLGAPGQAPQAAPMQPQPQSQTHKVLSLNAKTKRVTVASYTPAPSHSPSPAPSLAPDEPEESEGGAGVVPPLAREPLYARAPPPAARPWLDVRGDGFGMGPGSGRALVYVPDPEKVREQFKVERKERKAREKKAVAEQKAATEAVGK